MTHAEMDMLDWLLLLAFDRGVSHAVGQAPLPVADAGIERMLAAAESAWRARLGERATVARPAWLEAVIAEQGAKP
jgi:hypothetical protein